MFLASNNSVGAFGAVIGSGASLGGGVKPPTRLGSHIDPCPC